MSKSQYINSFDGLRAIAVTLVVIFHGSYGIVKGGWIGVDIFFILSGFLITSLLKNEYISTGGLVLKKFYLKRLARLLPALLLCIILNNILWDYVSQPAQANRFLATTASLFYAGNIVSPLALSTLGIVWSLSVEEHFYLIWPPLLIGSFFVLSEQRRITYLIASITFIWVFRILTYTYFNDIKLGLFEIDAYRFTFCRLDTILIGSLLALLPHSKLEQLASTFSSKPIAIISWVFIVLVCFTVYTDNIYYRNGGFVVTNLLCLSVVLFAVKNPNSLFLSNRILTWVGRRSYGIYLYHSPIFLALENFRIPGSKINLLAIMFLRLGLTIIITELSFRFIEQPILRRYSLKQKQQLLSSGVQ